MLSLTAFLPDLAAEESVVRALDEMRRVYTRQGRLDELRSPVAQLVASPDPRAVYTHREAMCRDHFVMLYAATTDCVPLFRLRIEGVGERSKLEFFFKEAALMGSASVIRYLGGQGVDVNAVPHACPHQHTALHWAVDMNHPDTVAALLAQPGIDLERLDAHGTTPLDLALRRSPHLTMAPAELLTAAGARINPHTVVVVARGYNAMAMDLVLRHGADPNAFSPKTGIAPLHAAAREGNADMVRRLLAAGADPLLPTRRKGTAGGVVYPRGATPLEYAELSGAAAGGVSPRGLLTRAIAGHAPDAPEAPDAADAEPAAPAPLRPRE